MSDELLPGAVTALRHAIHPLAYPQHLPNGHTEPALYLRVRQALTAATLRAGAPMQASKAPVRIDALNWLTRVDGVIAIVAPKPRITTIHKMRDLHDHTWNPTQLQQVQQLTKFCIRAVHTGRQLLGDNPPAVPLKEPCPACSEMWFVDSDRIRHFALLATFANEDWIAHCLACSRKWISDPERALLRKMLGHADTT